MNEGSKNWPGIFGGLRVPFNYKIIYLGFLAILIFIGGVQVINLFAEEEYLISRTFHHLFAYLGPTATKGFNAIYAIVPCQKAPETLLTTAPEIRSMAALLVWLFIIFAFFGGAISRMAAIHLAKEDSIPVGKALGFAWKHKFSLFLTPFCLALVIAFFYGCNWLAGYLATIVPGGPIIFILVFVLVLISTLFIILLVIGLVFGTHLIPPVIGTEGCDGMEAVISILNHIYTRPWSYITHHIMVAVSLILLVALGGTFIELAYQSSLVSDTKVEIVVNGEKKEAEIVSYKFHSLWNTVDVNYKFSDQKTPPQQIKYYLNRQMYEKAEKSYKAGRQTEKPLFYEGGMEDVWAFIQGSPVESWTYDRKKNQTFETQHAMNLNDFWHLSKYWACIGGILAFVYYALQYLVLGYAFAYIFAAGTTIYFLMRKEVDGIDFEEIFELEPEEGLQPVPVLPEKPKDEKVGEKPEEEKKPEEKKPEEKKPEEKKPEEKKPEEKKPEEKKPEEKKPEEKKPEEKKPEEKKPEEKKPEEKKPEEKKPEEKKPEEKKPEEKKPEEKKPEEKKPEEKKPEEKKPEEKKPEEKKPEEKKPEEKKPEEKKPEEKKPEEKKPEEKKPEEKKPEEKKPEEKKPEEKKPEEKKPEEKKPEEKKPEEKDEEENQAKKKSAMLDSGTMAIPLIRRKDVEKKNKKSSAEFMD